MIEKFYVVMNRIMAICAILAIIIGFGNAIRCAFFLDYDRIADKVFYTVLFAMIGVVGLWMMNIKENM